MKCSTVRSHCVRVSQSYVFLMTVPYISILKYIIRSHLCVLPLSRTPAKPHLQLLYLGQIRYEIRYHDDAAFWVLLRVGFGSTLQKNFGTCIPDYFTKILEELQTCNFIFNKFNKYTFLLIPNCSKTSVSEQLAWQA